MQSSALLVLPAQAHLPPPLSPAVPCLPGNLQAPPPLCLPGTVPGPPARIRGYFGPTRHRCAPNCLPNTTALTCKKASPIYTVSSPRGLVAQLLWASHSEQGPRHLCLLQADRDRPMWGLWPTLMQEVVASRVSPLLHSLQEARHCSQDKSRELGQSYSSRELSEVRRRDSPATGSASPFSTAQHVTLTGWYLLDSGVTRAGEQGEAEHIH